MRKPSSVCFLQSREIRGEGRNQQQRLEPQAKKSHNRRHKLQRKTWSRKTAKKKSERKQLQKITHPKISLSKIDGMEKTQGTSFLTSLVLSPSRLGIITGVFHLCLHFARLHVYLLGSSGFSSFDYLPLIAKRKSFRSMIKALHQKAHFKSSKNQSHNSSFI